MLGPFLGTFCLKIVVQYVRKGFSQISKVNVATVHVFRMELQEHIESVGAAEEVGPADQGTNSSYVIKFSWKSRLARLHLTGGCANARDGSSSWERSPTTLYVGAAGLEDRAPCKRLHA